MNFEQSRSEQDDQAENEALSNRWLEDVQALRDFSDNDRRKIEDLQAMPNSVSIFAWFQIRRQARLEDPGDGIDIIGTQLERFRKIFGLSAKTK